MSLVIKDHINKSKQENNDTNQIRLKIVAEENCTRNYSKTLHRKQ